MPTIIYRARSQTDLCDTRELLRRNGIDAMILGDPNRNLGHKVSFLVELAVADEQAGPAREIIARHASAEDERIRPLTKSIRRGAVLVVAIIALVSIPLLLFAPDIAGKALLVLFIGGWIGLSVIAARKSTLRERRLASGRCVEGGYDLRGNQSGKCPECGERKSHRQRMRRVKSRR